MNLMMLLEMAAADADRAALACGDLRLSTGDLMAAAGRIARHVRASGAEHVAFLDVGGETFPLALFGAAWAGVPFAPINYRLAADEIGALLERVAPAVLVTSDERVDELRGVPGITPIGRSELGEIARSGEDAPAGDWPMDPDAIAVLLFTSGTTGVPKAAVLRHRHLVSYVLGTVEFMAAGPGDAALISVPPYHVAGIASVLTSLYGGRRIVQMPAFDADGWIDLAAAEQVTNAFVVPTMLMRITAELDARGHDAPASLRSLAYGGGKMPLPVIERALERFPKVAFTNAYGLTETSSTIALLGPDDHRQSVASADPAARRRLGSAGRPLPGVEIEIRDEEGRALPAGERGEIHVRGEQVSGEYLGRGSQLLEGGWFPTRDGGFLDEEGFLFVEGRIDDVIVRGGENLSPGEIEDVLHAHPDVADCAVVGVPSEQWGEGVAAAIVLTPGAAAGEEALRAQEEALRAHVNAHLRSSRVPERIAFVDELPYNETGKLLRRVVREQLGGGE